MRSVDGWVAAHLFKQDGYDIIGVTTKVWPESRALAEGGSSGIFAGMSITVIVENDTIKLPVHVPDGTRLEITLPGEGEAGATGKAEEVTAALLAMQRAGKGAAVGPCERSMIITCTGRPGGEQWPFLRIRSSSSQRSNPGDAAHGTAIRWSREHDRHPGRTDGMGAHGSRRRGLPGDNREALSEPARPCPEFDRSSGLSARHRRRFRAWRGALPTTSRRQGVVVDGLHFIRRHGR